MIPFVAGDFRVSGRYERSAALVLAMILALAGCRQTDHQPAVDLLRDQTDLPTGRLDRRAKADMQIALARNSESTNREAAIKLLEEALQLDPNRTDARHRLAVLYDRQGDFEAAEPHYAAALKAHPDDAELLCDRGYSLYLQGKTDQAENILRQAIAADPRCARAHNNLGLLLGRQGRTDEALAQFAAAGGSKADCEANLAFALALEGRLDDARRHYQTALELDPGSPLATRGLTLVEPAQRRLSHADPALRRVSITPEDSR